MAWTRFMDMHSGGGAKEAPYECKMGKPPATSSDESGRSPEVDGATPNPTSPKGD